MRRLLYIIIGIIVLGVVSTSCENKALNRQLDDLDTLMRVNPDSVYAVLDSMDTRKMSKHQRMRHALLLADAQNKAYIDFTTDSAMIAVADYYDHHGTPNEQMRAHYLLGCTYRDMDDVPMELQCFLDATEKADTVSKDCDLYTLAAIYGQMADLYDNQFLPNEELKALDNCEKIARLDKDTLGTIKARELRFRPYHLAGIEDSVISVINEARSNYLRLRDTTYAAILTIPAINSFIKKGEFNNVRKYIDIFETEGKVYKDGKVINNQVSIFNYHKGEFLLHEEKVDSAKICFYNFLTSSMRHPN